MEAAGGIVLLLCTAAALVLANSPCAEGFSHFWHHTTIGFNFAGLEISYSLEHWINDGLMTLFFFVIGLEIKRELVHGELRDPRTAALPVLGAAGGMLVPACIYAFVMWGQHGINGWGIPMATDIAFVVGFLALLGPRVPIGLKIFLLSLAIADDIGAVLVIAIFYTSEISFAALGLAGTGFLVVILFNVIGVRSLAIYFFLGAGIWLAMVRSGVHPTVAGVLLGLLTPSRGWLGPVALKRVLAESLQRLQTSAGHPDQVAASLEEVARESISPLERLQRAWHPWVAFVIMPLFALANAGVAIDMRAAREPVALAVILGLVIGKPVGIAGASWLGVKSGMARLPAGVNWSLLCAGSCLGGIGFTMSLFITGLAFGSNETLLTLLAAAKIGTLAGSLASALIGSAWAYSSLVTSPKS